MGADLAVRAEAALAGAAPVERSHPPAGGAVRMHSPDVRLALEQFANAELLTAGKVNVIALDVLAERFGRRWALRREQVHAHVDTVLARQLGAEGYHLRISHTDVLVCHPELGRFAGQAACLRYLREILSHFLGEETLPDCTLHEVLSISGGCVEARRIDPRALRSADDLPDAEAPSPATRRSAGAEPTSPATDRWAPFLAADGRRVRVSCGLEPVFELKGYGRIGFRVARRILPGDSEIPLSPAELGKFSRADLLRVDIASIARGLDRLAADRLGQRQPSLIIPVSLASLSSTEGRAQIVAALRTANRFVQRGLICELSEVEGVPASTLISATAVVRPFSLFVIARLHGTTAPDSSILRGCGIQGLSVECPSDLDEHGLLDWGRPRVAAFRRITKSVLVYRANSSRQLAMAAQLGATHASMGAA